jgi:cell division protein FtsB
MPILRKLVFAMVLTAVALAGFCFVHKLIRPIHLCWEGSTEVGQLQKKLASLKQENEALRNEKKYLLSPGGAQTEARKFQFVKPGEISLILGEKDKPK